MADITKRYNRKYDEPMNHREQAELYYNVLSRSGAAATFFCTINEDKKYGQYCTRNESAFVDQFDKHWNNENCYIPLNLFSGEYRYNKKKQKRGWFRTEQDVVAVNGILVDFDIMKNKGKNPNVSYTIKTGDELVDEIIEKMEELVDEDRMVYPTLLTKSGRGLQYIILYEDPISKSDEEAMFKHKRLYKKITTYLQSLYDKDLVEVDTAVTDAPRICRLPGTRHLKNDRFAELVEYNPNCMYDLDELCEIFDVDLSTEEFKERKKCGRPRKEKADKKPRASKKVSFEYVPSSKVENNGPVSLSQRQRCNIKGRVAMMKKLAEKRGMEKGDMREVMCFWYYNHQRQLYQPQTAMFLTCEFNRTFEEPLGDAELHRCIIGVQNHVGEDGYPDGYYVCSKATLASQLCMSEEEIKATGYYKRKEEIERAAANSKKKEESKQLLFAMLKKGNLSKSEVVAIAVERTGMSRATIYRWIADYEEKREKKDFVSKSHLLEKNNNIGEIKGSHFSQNEEGIASDFADSACDTMDYDEDYDECTSSECEATVEVCPNPTEAYEDYCEFMERQEYVMNAIAYRTLSKQEYILEKDYEHIESGKVGEYYYLYSADKQPYSNAYNLSFMYRDVDKQGKVGLVKIKLGTIYGSTLKTKDIHFEDIVYFGDCDVVP